MHKNLFDKKKDITKILQKYFLWNEFVCYHLKK